MSLARRDRELGASPTTTAGTADTLRAPEYERGVHGARGQVAGHVHDEHLQQSGDRWE